MRALRATFLTVIYVAFIAASVVSGTTCPESCAHLNESHFAFAKSGVPPTGCAEEEQVNKPASEHRAHKIIKFSEKSGSPSQILTYENRGEYIIAGNETIAVAGSCLYAVPIYKKHCSYRL